MTKTQISYGIVLEEEILYCSNEEKYMILEIILFVEKLIRGFNPKHTWRLNSICLKSAENKERLIIRHELTETNKNLFFVVCGVYEERSQEIRNILGEFYQKVNDTYNNRDVLEKCSKKPIFKEIIKIITDFLCSKYEILLEHEEIKQEVDHDTTNKLLYGGISSQGLPIISKLFEPTLLNNLDKEVTAENVELFNSSFSAQLATIEMNTIIRTNTYNIKEIHIFDLEDKKNNKIILYDNIDKHHFSLTIFASGNFFEIKDVMKLLKIQISKENILHKEFSGDIKLYKYLEDYFLGLDREF